MSKRELKKYLSSLKKYQLEEQIEDLYNRFKDVKAYYDFAFNPREEKLLEKSKFAIHKEYFPAGRKKAKKRRSVAQKHIRYYKQLGVDPWVVSEIMIYNIEVAQSYNALKPVTQDAFFVSMLRSFEEAILYISSNGLMNDFKDRISQIADEVQKQNWFNKSAFEKLILNRFHLE